MSVQRTGTSPPDFANAADPAELEALRAENERLKDLVIKLAATTIRNVFYDSQGDAKSSTRAEQVLATADACLNLARLPNMRPKLAEALETLGRELSVKAVEIETKVQRRKRPER